MTSERVPQDIEQLKTRHRKLERDKAAAEANLQNATENLEALQAEAREKFGTDELEKLKAMLEQMRRDNEQKRAAYQQHLDQIESKLAEVERQFVATRKPM